MKRSLPLLAAIMLPIILLSCRSRVSYSTEERILVNRLLSCIDSADYYRAGKEAALEKQKAALAAADSNSREWSSICIGIAEDYGNYIADSSIAYSNKALSRIDPNKSKDLYLNAVSCKLRALNRTGYFVEAGILMDAIKPSDFSPQDRWRYYAMKSDYYHSLYTSIPRGWEYRERFTECYSSYRDTLLSLLPPESSLITREQEKIAARQGRIDDALKLNDIRLENTKDGDSRERSTALFDRHSLYRYYMKRPVEDHVEYLLESAILDITSANQNIASLRQVEAYLVSRKDLSSAKKVSDYYYSALLHFGSKTRLLDALDISMRINNEYSRLLAHQKRQIQASFIGIILLLLVIILILKLVLDSRRNIEELNHNLARSSKTALSYVLGFFNLYSSYISRLLSLRSKINVNVRRGNYDYVLSLTDPSKDITSEELKGMYSNFDSAFLDICPDYVEKFNALLKPECRITPKSDEKLNMELRIFAIIKLGITDSTKISELLHCSIKTVYNKRSEINTKLAVDKDAFMKKLLDI
ncbi:MAG: hypothetical protein J5835_00750 [Bacteroidales bacterium]|nr:hypothetical protein [Bacteroidales bacterium]